MYGSNYNDAPVKKFKAGINENVVLKNVSLEEVITANYDGYALDFIYEKEGDEQKDRMFPVNESQIKPRDVYKDGVKEIQTQEEAVQQAYGNFNSKVKHVICNFVEEDKFEAAVKGSTSFEDFCKRVISLLPANYNTQGGKLILSYDNKGFLQVPSAMWVTGAFFTVGDKHDLTISSRVKLTAPQQPESTPTQNANW